MDKFSDFLLEMPMEQGQDLGLLVYEPNNPSIFILMKNSPGLKNAINNYDYETIENAIYGVMNIRSNSKYNALEVNKVWARSGYGPLLYYIAMSYSGKAGLMSSRVEKQVSPEAKSIWSNFHSGVGKDKVNPVPLDSDFRHHPEDYLMNKYVLKSKMNLRNYLLRGKQIVGRDPYGEKFDTIMEVAEGMLDSRMNDIYGRN